jgi:hypothetical protein
MNFCVPFLIQVLCYQSIWTSVCLFLFYEFQRQLLCFIFSATTLDEYRKHIEKDPGLERCFQPVKVPEPLVDETIKILRGF